MKKILVISLFFLSINIISKQKEKQCLVCVCEVEGETIISEPMCNYEDPKLAIHSFTKRELCKEEGDKICKKYCEEKKCKHKSTKLWGCK